MATEDVYCTLLLNDAYLPGAQVLAHSLRDAGTTKRLAVLVTLAGVTKHTVTELKKLYDYVIPVEPIYSRSVTNLNLMNRPDLSSALTKIHLWKQTQFRKIVFLDADTVALRAPDELFDVDADFAASPDIGWPDCFNSGMMLSKPSTKTYEELLELARQGATFDGADQGLLNQHFDNWHRLSFNYNCTVGNNMAYQYAPAFKHYGANVAIVHFIGEQKPWNRGNIPGLTGSPDPYDKLSGHWWSVWNKHLGKFSSPTGSEPYHAGGGGSYKKDDDDDKRDDGSGGAAGGSGAKGGAPPSGSAPNPPPSSSGSAPSEAPRGAPTQGAGNRAHEYAPSQESPPTERATQVVSEDIQPIQEEADNTPPQLPVEFRRGSVGISPPAAPSPVPSRSASSSDGTQSPAAVHTPKFVPIRSINMPSRYNENFAPAEPSTTVPRTHYQQYVSGGNFGDYVLTREGPVPQAQYFQTGADSYYIQRYTSNGEPIPSSVIIGLSTPPFIKEGSYHQDAQFARAPQFWDPTKSAPPLYGVPEGSQLHIQPYENEWDKPFPPPKQQLWHDIPQEAPSKAIFPWEQRPRQVARVFMDTIPRAPEPEAMGESETPIAKEETFVPEARPVARSAEAASVMMEPPLKALFPWEEKPRTVTRVFAGEEDSAYAESEDASVYGDEYDDLPRSMASPDAGETWMRFSSRENKWDTDPAIRDYVLRLRSRRNLAHNDAAVVPGALDEVPSVTPAPRRAVPGWVEEDDEYVEEAPEWDPEKKLEELRRLPTSFIAELMAKHMKSASAQTDGDAIPKQSEILYPSRPTYCDSSMQTDPLPVEDKGVQCGYCDEHEAMINGMELERAIFEHSDSDSDHDGSMTPKLSLMGMASRFRTVSFSFDDADLDLKAIADIPFGGRRSLTRTRRSIDSALGSVISDE